MGGCKSACSPCPDLPYSFLSRSSRWAQLDVKADLAWLDLFRKEYVQTPVQKSIFRVVTQFCQSFRLNAEPFLHQLRQHQLVLQKLQKLHGGHNNFCDVEDNHHDAALQDLENPNLEEHFLSIYSYTMDTLFEVANRHINNADKRSRMSDSGVAELSDEVKAILPWFKKLAVGLYSLPSSFNYSGTAPVYRVMRFIYNPLDFAVRFKEGNRFVWHNFRSSSTSDDILYNPYFSAAHCTVFEIHDAVGKRITYLMSQFPYENEVLLPFGATFQVEGARRGSGEGNDIRISADWITLTMLPQVFSLESGISDSFDMFGNGW